MLLTRASCRFGIITPPLLHILGVLEEHARFHDLTVIGLSGTDGGHTLYSGHAEGKAFDFRCRDLLTDKDQRHFLADLVGKLGPEFAGAHEHVGLPNDHYHLQLKRGVTFHALPVQTHAARFSTR